MEENNNVNTQPQGEDQASTDQPVASVVTETSAPQASGLAFKNDKDSFWLGVKTYIVGTGFMMLCMVGLGIVMSIVLGIERVAGLESQATIIAVLIMFYPGYLLAKQYSGTKRALIGAMMLALITSAASLVYTLDLGFDLMTSALELIALGLGWYLATSTDLKLPMPNRGWTKAYYVIGIILMVLIVFGFLGTISGTV